MFSSFYSLFILLFVHEAICGSLKATHCAKQPPHLPGARELIDKSLAALGGSEALEGLKSVTYEIPKIYRTQSLMQSYNMLKADVYVAIDGSQNISFAYPSEKLQQRIDRRFTRSEYWYFGSPSLDPVEFSLVVQDGDERFASYVRGNDYIFEDPKETSGFQDNGFVQYSVHQANAMSPKLLTVVAANNVSSSSVIAVQSGVYMPAIHDTILNLTIIFDPETYLPYIIRTYENHFVYGPSTQDLQLTQYTRVNGIMFPRRFMTIYNEESVLEDFLVQRVATNQSYEPGFFSGQPRDGRPSRSPPPIDLKEYSQSEIGEFSQNMLWGGAYTGTYGNISAKQPIPNVPQLWHLMFPDAPNYENLVLEFIDGVMVLDAPPHQSKLIIKWVRANLEKPITHIWTTHHHHDHSGGVSDFTALGATLIIPEVAEKYWRTATPNATLVTYNDTHPYIHHDAHMQVRFLWETQAIHAVDWSYAIVTSACPGPNDGIVAFEADAWSPGTNAKRFDVNFARQWLRQAQRDGLSREARVIAVHGSNRPLGSKLHDLINVAGYAYPPLNTTSWTAGGGICLT